jgi:hypothetical protein
MKAVLALLLAGPALACNCTHRQSVCGEVASPGAVFIGTVESTAPSFMSRWFPLSRPALNRLNAVDERYLADPSATGLAPLKDALRNLFPNLPEDDRQRLDNADTHASIVSIFNSVLAHGQRVHFRVRTVFRNGEDDDDAPKAKTGKDLKDDAAKDKDDKDNAKKDDDDDAVPPEGFDVWTPFGDCGLDFQPGETYLVYAGTDEETNILETDSCTRTRRVTDAGEDLAYLYFYKDKKNPAGRLEGFATFDPLYQVHQANHADPDTIDQPAPGVVIELKSASGFRYTTTAPSGRFVFDGLEAGDHQITAYGAGFPASAKVLAGPRKFRTAERACASQTLLVPGPPP